MAFLSAPVIDAKQSRDTFLGGLDDDDEALTSHNYCLSKRQHREDDNSEAAASTMMQCKSFLATTTTDGAHSAFENDFVVTQKATVRMCHEPPNLANSHQEDHRLTSAAHGNHSESFFAQQR